jgi:hypothetical protein
LSNEGVYLAVTSIVAGTFVAVWLAAYVPLSVRFVRWYTRSSWRTIREVRPLARSEPMRSITKGVGIVAVAGWRVCLAFYLAILIWVALPLAISVLALQLSFHLLRPG